MENKYKEWLNAFYPEASKEYHSEFFKIAEARERCGLPAIKACYFAYFDVYYTREKINELIPEKYHG